MQTRSDQWEIFMFHNTALWLFLFLMDSYLLAIIKFYSTLSQSNSIIVKHFLSFYFAANPV